MKQANRSDHYVYFFFIIALIMIFGFSDVNSRLCVETLTVISLSTVNFITEIWQIISLLEIYFAFSQKMTKERERLTHKTDWILTYDNYVIY